MNHDFEKEMSGFLLPMKFISMFLFAEISQCVWETVVCVYVPYLV